MNSGGISGRLFDFARAIVGSLRGGLAHVNVVTSMFFGGMIGSSTADLAGTGSIVIPAMKDAKYPADFSAALTASSAGIGLAAAEPLHAHAARRRAAGRTAGSMAKVWCSPRSVWRLKVVATTPPPRRNMV